MLTQHSVAVAAVFTAPVRFTTGSPFWCKSEDRKNDRIWWRSHVWQRWGLVVVKAMRGVRSWQC